MIRRVSHWQKQFKNLNPVDQLFGTISSLFLLAYLIVRGSPSSYSLVYRAMGINSSTIFGFPQPIRSDEYGISTTKLIAAKLANWNPININSVYQERFGPAFPVPRRSVSMIFDIFQWPYFVLPADWAYSLYWVLLFACGIFGWRILLGKLNITPFFAWLGVFLLIFNSFQQAWLTVLGNNFFIFPLIALAVINNSKRRLRLPSIFLIGAAVFSVSLYVPGLVPICYTAAILGFIQIHAKKLSWKHYVGNLIALMLGMITIIGLRFSEFQALNQTDYPGARWGRGGGVSLSHWASQFLPTLPYTGWETINGLNTCEMATVGTLLPLFLFFYSLLNINQMKRIDVQTLFTQIRTKYFSELLLLVAFGIFTFWQLRGFPEWLAKLSFLGHAGASRTFMASGAILIILCLKVLSRGVINLRKLVIAIFITALANGIIGYFFASQRTEVDYVEKFSLKGAKRIVGLLFNYDDWIASAVFIGIVLLLLLLKRLKLISNKFLALATLSAVLIIPNLMIWGTFNPIYSSTKIFEITKSPIAKNVAEYFREKDLTIILPGSLGPSGWYGNIGIRTPQSIQEIPPNEYWRKLLGTEYSKYKTILNRYAYIEVIDIPEPILKNPDYIQVPLSWFFGQPDVIIPIFTLESQGEKQPAINSSDHKIICGVGSAKTKIDSLQKTSANLNFVDVTITGWLKEDEIHNYSVSVEQKGNKKISFGSLSRQTRFDVMNVVNFPSGVSGFSLVLRNVQSDSCYTVTFKADG